MSRWTIAAALLAVAAPTLATSAETVDPVQPYLQHCAACHGSDRLGLVGPALLPENLSRLRRPAAHKVIAEGRVASQMPGFADKLDAPVIAALVDYIYAAPATPPVWTRLDIVRSHRVLATPAADAKPVYKADPWNLFVVVEAGDHHITILDGDRLAPIKRLPTRFALHGGPKFSPDGRFVYFASRDGWISKLDLRTLTYTAEVRAGINTRNLALSHDGRIVIVGNYLPHTLVMLDARDLSLIQDIPAVDTAGRSSRVSAVYQAAPRNSFIVALKDVPEVLEIPIAAADPRGGHALYGHGPFTEEMRRAARLSEIRHIRLDTILDDFFFTQDYRHLLGAARDGGQAVVLDLAAGKVVARLPIAGMPHLGSGISWERDGGRVLATPNIQNGLVTVIDERDWSVVTTITTLGPGFFMRSHSRSPWAWVDVFTGPDRDVMHVIDKQSLTVARTLRPSPGRTSGHIEFDRHGRWALLSIWEDDGEIIVYDAQTLKEHKRLPMRRPVGKYNVYNKVHKDEGTSH
jgi:mono/diheme cytochrome c family protein